MAAGRIFRSKANQAAEKVRSQAVSRAKRSANSKAGNRITENAQKQKIQNSTARNQANIERYKAEMSKNRAANSAFSKLDSNKLPEVYSRASGDRINPRSGEKMYDQAINAKRYAQEDAAKQGQRELKERLQAKHGGKPKSPSGGGAGSAPSFNVSGHQGLDKLRFMESRGAKPTDLQRRNALSGDMRRNFAEQGGMSRVGVSALRGAAVGGVAGGTVESMQGGDFWDGAKSGAFYGATGMAGVRATRQAVGAQSYLGKNGIMGTMRMNKENYGVGVKDLMLNQQNVGRAKDVMDRVNKKK